MLTMNKSRVLKLGFFLAVLFVGDRVGGGMLMWLVGKSGQRFPMVYSGKLEADVAILGNSRGIHMFHPPAIEREVGGKVANLSFNDLPPAIMPILWGDYLQHHAPPRLLVLEVSCIGVVDYPASTERFTVLMPKNVEFGRAIYSENPRHYWLSQLSHLFRFNSPLTWRSLLFLKRDDQSWIMNSQLNETMMTETIANADAELRKDQTRLDAIKRTIAIAEEHNVEVRCVIAPYAPLYFERLDGFDSWLDWVESSLGRPVEDLSQQVTEMEHFADHLHLHEAGASHFAKALSSQGFFTSENTVLAGVGK